MKQPKLTKNLLIFLLGFLSFGAIFGGMAFILKPDGSIYDMPVEILQNSPFKDFLVPGIILFVTFGLLPVYVIYTLIKKPENKAMEKLNLLPDHHFSWTFSIYIGFALIIWINIQTLILDAVDILHTIYSSLGILIICMALLPKTREIYKT
jgi:hypothetical protein